jgi:hypothetical protein
VSQAIFIIGKLIPKTLEIPAGIGWGQQIASAGITTYYGEMRIRGEKKKKL